MKELSIEEKAQRYNEAIGRAKDFMNGEVHYALKEGENIMCWVFPELREGGDERIWIINYLSNRILNSTIIAEKENLKKAIAWLKNQGEQKPAWSEEDENTRKKIIKFLEEQNYFDGKANEFKKPYEKEYEWLKSIKDRYTWKPSEGQMKLLREVQQALLGKDCHNRFVNFMYELKRLREE